MEPIPETIEALDELGPFAGGEDILRGFPEIDRQVRDIVPDCVGLSVASRELGVIFTLVASSDEIAVMDALQYLTGGPCVEAVTGERVLRFTSDQLLDEEEWRLFAQGTAATGILSTLSLPIVTDGQVTGSINLYGGSPQAFTGHHEQLAGIFGAWASGAVTNADLPFRTRLTASQAPRLLRARTQIDTAVGILAATEGIQIGEAAQRLRDASQRAGIDELELAESLIRLRENPTP
jgi:GAF domain-containing protein